MIERLTGSDALLLHTDVADTPMHTLKTAVLDSAGRGRPITLDHLADGITGVIGLIPRLSQRVRAPRWMPGRPFWVSDPDFDVRNHLDEVIAEPPGDRFALDRIHTKLAGRRLSRDRPLWGVTLVNGLEGGRQAVITRVHHAVVDGGGALNAFMLLTARGPGVEMTGPPGTSVRVTESELRCQALREAPRLLLDLPLLLGDTVRSRRRTHAFRRQHAELPVVMTAPRNFVTADHGVSRLCASADLPLDTIRRVSKMGGVTVNGVFHALIAAAFRDELLANGDSLAGATAAFGVATDDGNPLRLSGNLVTPAFVRLDTVESDPLRRLERTAQSCRDAVELQRLGGGDLTDRWATYFCRIVPWSQRRFGRRMPTVPNHITTANVRGPDHRRWAGHVEITDWISYAVVVSPANINITAYSYDDRFSIGMLVGHGVLDDPYRFLGRMQEELDVLESALSAGKAR